jgi:hypothetical protein
MNTVSNSFTMSGAREDAYPDRYTTREDAFEKTDREVDGSKLFGESVCYEVPVWCFSDGESLLRAKRPVVVRFSRGSELFLAEHDGLDIYASGESLADAVDCFNRLLVQFFWHYKQIGWDRVSGDAKRLKYVFEDQFSEA